MRKFRCGYCTSFTTSRPKKFVEHAAQEHDKDLSWVVEEATGKTVPPEWSEAARGE